MGKNAAQRQKLYQKLEGQSVVVTTGHETILHQKGEKPAHIPYEVKRIGKIKRYRGRLAFIEHGRRTPYSFLGVECKSIVKRKQKKRKKRKRKSS